MPAAAPGVYAELADLVALRHAARGFSLLPRQPVASLLAGRHASRLRGRGLNFEEVRKYLPGDDVRQIDWKVTARTRTPHTRVYTEERERPVVLVIDQRLGMFFGSRVKLKSVAAAEAAALAAWRTVGVQDRVGAVVFNDAGAREVRPQRSRGTVMRILGHVVEMNRALRADSPVPPAPEKLNEAIRHARTLTPHDGLVVVITDGAGSDAETRRLVTETARHNDALVVFVFDPLEADLPAVGRVVASDGAGQLEVDTGTAAVRDAFRADLADRRAAARHFLLTREVPVLPLRTDEPVVQQLTRALGHHPPGAKS
ncbi:MAG TPA: DUF58 domain-containing protein [Urbifossiella sp.]|jgi:uncharacterized protein (DUF58 family)|nr:DUF58 domain-containing protein [Urbifossiella sp.]